MKQKKEEQVTDKKRFYPNILKGLSYSQIEQRKTEGLVNYDTSFPSKSIKSILLENIFTLFNLINIALAIAVFLVGSYKNMLFLGIVICNTLISIVQEIRSKKAVDKLAILSAAQVKVIREGEEELLGINELVLDDLVILQTGDQIVADCLLQQGEIEVNESFITGEPDAISKKQHDLLRSGSYVVSGKAIAKIEHIGEENYAAQISKGAKYVKKLKSEIMTSVREVIRTVSIIIIPVGTFLLLHQLDIVGNSIEQAVVNTVAALIGMIPEGLVLLTSTVLAVSTIRLARKKVLVQDLYCIEMLARVDTLCLDKTGTLTQGKMEVSNLYIKRGTQQEVEEILANIAKASEDENVTIEAIRRTYQPKESWLVKQKIAFSSAKKWSGIEFEKQGTYVIGAPEFVLEKGEYQKYQKEVENWAKESRVLVLVHCCDSFQEKQLPKVNQVIAFLQLQDTIRKEAKRTLKYFKKQEVDIKLISGDNPITVSAIAKRVGMEQYDSYLDVSNLTQEELKKVAEQYTIFGRVSPMQKQLLIQALKEKGHTVAMTGDGVNDVLALKEADCSIAIASGTDAARNVSQLVLLNSDFQSMPKVVEEGRRSINNLQRSASLFLVKTVYSTILAILFIFLDIRYPFIPIQLTLISVFAIGIPSFILALEPNHERVKGKFIYNVIAKSFPAAITIVLNIFLVVIASKIFNLTFEQYSSICVVLTALTEFTLLYKICIPFNIIRKILFITMLMCFFVCCMMMRQFFFISALTWNLAFIIIGLACLSLALFLTLYYIAEKVFSKKKV